VTKALSGAQRGELEQMIGQARVLLEEDLGAQATGRFGIDPDGTIANESELHLDPTRAVDRRELVEVVEHFVSEGEPAPRAVERMLREATFTHLNRLVAIRIAETQGLLRPSIGDGRASQGFRDLLELAPLLATDDTDGYGIYLSFCGDELAGDVPMLFDPRSPLLALAPSPAALDRLVGVLGDQRHSALWQASDCLGWVYQFFNTAEERKAMRDVSAAPRDSRELAVRNQFFTPRYVVDFLVQNSLGRRLLDADPASPLLADLPLLVDPPSEATRPVSLDEVTVLDPACGSGHFLLASYDLLERAFAHLGVSARDAAPRILPALWGIDIDPRCVQVAAAALSFRARRSCPDLALPAPNLICARALPATTSGLSELLRTLPKREQELASRLVDLLDQAPVLGSLLKVEERLASEVRGSFPSGGPEQPRLFPGASEQLSLSDAVPVDEVAIVEGRLLAALQRLAEAATASPTERLLFAEATDAVRFIEAMRRRYDAVVMNPPFGEPVPETKGYLHAAYSWLPGRTSDLLAAFVGRGLELCKPGGYVGAITNRTALYIKTFEAWRRQVLLGNELVCMADLGFGVMEGAMVEAAAYVVRASSPGPESVATFVRLLKDQDRPAALADAISHSRAGTSDARVRRVAQAEFAALPQAPIAYSVGPTVRRLIKEGPALEGHAGEARQGLATADDFRFVRVFWEVDPARITTNVAGTFDGRRWVPFAKGGDYAPYWADIHLVVNWGHNGEEIKASVCARYPYLKGKWQWVVKNSEYYFRPGITWSPYTASGLSLRPLPAGCVFGHSGSTVFASCPWPLLAWLNSRLVRLTLSVTAESGEETKSGAPHLRYEVGRIQSLPAPESMLGDAQLGVLAEEVADELAEFDRFDETTRRFVLPTILDGSAGTLRERVLRAEHRRLDAVVEATGRYAEIDDRIAELIDLDATTREELDQVAGPLVARLPDTPLSDEQGELALALLAGSDREVIEAAVQTHGEARFIRVQHQVIDRRVELAALALGRSPSVLVDYAVQHELVPPDRLTEAARDLVSYLVGAALGRFDVRLAHGTRPLPESQALFDPVGCLAPGQLVGENGVAATQAPPGYPLDLPSAGVLVDEPGHAYDIEARILAAARVVLGGDTDSILPEATRVLGCRSVREYLRRGFFKDHLARYSKSRRRAPIYWALAIPSGRWGIWVYAPRLCRETLFAVVQGAAAREAAAAAEMARLVRERESGGAGRGLGEVASALEAEESLSEELRLFRTEAERIAGLGWEPDLDDGAVLCAAPLAGLFPAWGDLAAYRRDLTEGKYSWAGVAKWAAVL